MTTPLNWIIRTDEPFKGVSQSFTYMDKEGIERVAYTDLTLDQYKLDRSYPFKLVTSEELDRLTDDFTNGMITEPQEISEDDYFYALEVLPPSRYNKGVFHVSERIYSNMVNWYFKKDGKYYTFINRDNINIQEIIDTIASV